MVQRSSGELQIGALLKKLGVVLLLIVQFSFSQLLDRVVANVNGEPILESELKVAQMFYNIKNRDELVKLLVRKHLIAQYLRENGLNIPDEYIESVIQDIAKSNKKSVEELYQELYREGLSPQDLKDFLRVEVASTFGLKEYLRSRIKVSDVEIELEQLKRGDVKYLREVELLVVDKDRKKELLTLVEKYGAKINEIARELGEKVERLKVKKGELVGSLDREIWKVRKGEIAIAEDEGHIYLARVLREIKVISGRSEDEIKEELLTKKMKEKERELIEKLRKKSFVEIYS